MAANDTFAVVILLIILVLLVLYVVGASAQEEDKRKAASRPPTIYVHLAVTIPPTPWNPAQAKSLIAALMTLKEIIEGCASPRKKRQPS